MDLHKFWIMTNVKGPLTSKTNDSKYFIIEMTNCKTRERKTTYADEGLNNFSNWSKCVERQWGIYEGIKPHPGKNKEHLINGDSMPRLVETITQQQAKSFRETGEL